MTSILTLFQRTGLKPGKNYLFDNGNLSDAFNTWLEYNFNKYEKEVQFQKLAANLSIRFVMDQENYLTNMCDYARIETEGGETLYYFVTSCSWRAQSTIEVSLTLDVLNSFRDSFLDRFTAKTLTTRQHKDRFSGYNSLMGKVGYKVDSFSEGISPVLKLASKTEIVPADMTSDQRFYLIYATSSDLEVDNITNPVSVYLSAKNSIELADAVTGNIVTYTYVNDDSGDILTGKYYYFIPSENAAQMEIEFDGNTTITYDSTDDSVIFWYIHAFYGVYPVGSPDYRYYFQLCAFTKTGSQVLFSISADAYPVQIEFNSMIQYRTGNGELYTQLADIQSLFPKTILNSGTINALNIEPFAEMIDRTDSRLMKIIELPYAPTSLDYTNPDDIGGGLWKWSGGLLKLNSLNSEFLLEDLFAFDLSDYLTATIAAPELDEERRDMDDPKIQSAQFSTHAFVYDSFVKDIRLDNAVLSSLSIDPKIDITFKMNNSLAASFAFKFEPAAVTLQYNENFPEYLIVNRNNEIPIFSSGYVDYIRSGYNFDVKSKNTSAAASGAAAVAGVASTAFAAMASTNPAITIAVGAVSFVSSIASMVTSEVQAQNSLDSKLKQLSAQAASVSGSSDTETMGYYSDNKLWFVYYEPSAQVKAALNDLFYYYGYACNDYGVPDVYSRTWFNFLQCIPVFESETSLYISDYIAEIEERFQAGVTIFHPHEISDVVTYDYPQSRENWETSILS